MHISFAVNPRARSTPKYVETTPDATLLQYQVSCSSCSSALLQDTGSSNRFSPPVVQFCSQGFIQQDRASCNSNIHRGLYGRIRPPAAHAAAEETIRRSFQVPL